MITSYNEMPIGIYLRLAALIDADERQDLAIVALMSGKTEDELLSLPLAEYYPLRDGCAFLFYEPKPSPVRRSYTCGDFTLRAPKDFRYLSVAQYQDFLEFNKADDIVGMLSCALVPEGCEYGELAQYDPLEVQAAIRDHLPVTDALALRDFFADACRKSIAATLRSSARKTRGRIPKATRTEMKAVADSLRDGDFSPGWPKSPLAVYALGMKYTD